MEPDGDPVAAGGEFCPVDHVVMGDDADASATGIDLKDVDPETDVPPEPHVGLLDFDDVRDPESGGADGSQAQPSGSVFQRLRTVLNGRSAGSADEP